MTVSAVLVTEKTQQCERNPRKEAILHDIYQNHNDICYLQGDR